MLVNLSDTQIAYIRGCLEGERIGVEGLAIGWKSESAPYKRYVAEIAAIDSALAALDTPATPQPDWSSAPEWATHHIYNCMGSGLWTNDVAVVDTTWKSGWRAVIKEMDGQSYWSGYQLPLGIDWRTTLQQRPKEDK